MEPGNPSAGLHEDAPLVAVRRGALVESFHRGRFVFSDPAGNLFDAEGDPDGYAYARSSAKPFQAMPLILSGAADAFGLTDEELAVVCASHNAEGPHLRAVGSVLEKVGLTEEDLQSGAHPPMYAPAADELARSGEEPRPVHGNCSGKHAGMLALCVYEGWEMHGYRDPGHPLQRRVLETISRVCGLERDEVLIAGDNCGVPTFAVPLKNLATGFARLATGEGLPDDLAEAASRVRRAMRGYPFMVAGTGRLDTELMGNTVLVTKIGAEGVFCAGNPEGWGLALKVSDGASRAVRPAALEALSRRGVKPLRDEPSASPTRDLHGETVGSVGPLL